jgi:hypothetical protein
MHDKPPGSPPLQDGAEALSVAEPAGSGEKTWMSEVRRTLPPELTTPRLAAAWVYRTIEPYSSSAIGCSVCWDGGAAGLDPRPEKGLWLQEPSAEPRFFGGEFSLWLAALRPLLRR